MDPLRDTPPEVTDKLTRWGGKNEYGEPNWRIILAENHVVQRSGMWTEFAEDTEQVHFESRTHDVHYETRQIAPDAIRIGMFWVPLYQVTGWILERWFPASSYGTKDQWESALSQDGTTPMMGPFPARGGYFMLSGGGPWPEIPLLDDVRAAISQWENSAHLHGFMDEDAVNRAMRNASIEAEEAEERKYDDFLKEVTYQRKSQLGFIKGNAALSGYRNRLVNAKGLMSHI